MENREKLGPNVSLEAFQLFRLLGFDSLAESLNLEGTEREQVEYMCGMAMGRSLVRRGEVSSENLAATVRTFSDFYRRMGLGELYFRENPNGSLTMGIYECAGCAGEEPSGRFLCFVEAGLICGVLSEATGEDFASREVKCIGGRGDDACEFVLDRQ